VTALACIFVAFTLASLVVPPVVWWYFRPVLDDDGVEL
jgi:hypothetical protein